MAEHASTRFFSSTLRNLPSNDVADSTKLKLAFFCLAFDLLAVSRARTLGHDYECAQMAGGFAFLNDISNFVVIKRDLRNQNDVRAAGDAAMQRDPAGMATHYLDDHDALVTGRRGVQSIKRIH